MSVDCRTRMEVEATEEVVRLLKEGNILILRQEEGRFNGGV